MDADANHSRSAIQLTQLRAFAAVARVGTLTRAADELGYTEPAIHLQLSALYKAFGGPLFERAHRGMRLTPLGESLLPYATAALGAVDEMTTEASHHQAVASHVVRLGVGRSTGSYLFPHLAAAVREKFPEIQLQPFLMSVGELYDALARGALDIAYASSLGVPPPATSAATRIISTTPFRKYHWMLVASPRLGAQIAAGGGTFSIYLPEYARLMIPRIAEATPGSNSYSFTLAQDTEATKGAALADLGIACVPTYTVGSEIIAGSLVECFPGLPRLDSMIRVGHERRPRHPDVAKVVVATRRLPNFSADGLPLSRVPLKVSSAN